MNWVELFFVRTAPTETCMCMQGSSSLTFLHSGDLWQYLCPLTHKSLLRPRSIITQGLPLHNSATACMPYTARLPLHCRAWAWSCDCWCVRVRACWLSWWERKEQEEKRKKEWSLQRLWGWAALRKLGLLCVIAGCCAVSAVSVIGRPQLSLQLHRTFTQCLLSILKHF